ncbi:hypothetical protein QYE76_009796 [Lolium multiflorum]|uniref:CCHC-type domain-containing protein n=1 Tax=Lolium multiflorum TaxID=4521 RepID=A0AAD8TW01_LOLMU|nr:hypothetical protein QYE76_009796 [Lolium multiflorum]
MFKAALFSILADNIVDPYMTFEHGKDAWDALEAKFRARAKDTRARDFEGGSSANVVQDKNFQSHKFKNKNKSEGKGKFDGKNKASHSTDFKKKTDKKKGACHICGEPNHWAPNCPNHYDKRGNGGKTDNVVIPGDTEMMDVGYGRKDLLCADGKRLMCFCSWCWYGCKWVFKKKLRPDGTIEKYKARPQPQHQEEEKDDDPELQAALAASCELNDLEELAKWPHLVEK